MFLKRVLAPFSDWGFWLFFFKNTHGQKWLSCKYSWFQGSKYQGYPWVYEQGPLEGHFNCSSFLCSAGLPSSQGHGRERVIITPFYRQRKWESGVEWFSSVPQWLIKISNQKPGFLIPGLMFHNTTLPSMKYYFYKGFSSNKGSRPSHVTFIHESLCVFISTWVLCSWEQGRTPYIIILLPQELANQSRRPHTTEKQRACGLSRDLIGVLKMFMVFAFRFPIGNPFKRKSWLYCSFGDIPLIPRLSGHRAWMNSPFSKQNLNTHAFNGNSYLTCLIHTRKPILE